MFTMELSRKQQVEFYKREIEAILQEYEIYLKTGCNDLLEAGELFVGKYEFVDRNRGNIVFSFNKNNIPSIKIPYTALSMKNEFSSPERWNNLSYSNLRPKARKSSDSLPIYYYEKTNNNSIMIGFHEIDIEFESYLNKGQNVIFGKKDPPINYLKNLIEITNRLSPESKAGNILDFNYQKIKFKPELREDSDEFTNYYKNELIEKDITIIQGPPGTGKTTLIANICKHLLDNDNSVLCTTMANVSLLELASKEILIGKLINGQIKKTNLNYTEKKALPKLLISKEIKSEKGVLLLTTYYKMSQEAVKLPNNPIFDYIIIEEASQTFLGTIAACRLLARKLIIVGDPKQLPPVINQRNPELISRDIVILTKSLEFYASNTTCPKFRLTSTYRLMNRAAKQTGIFYENTLVSKSTIDSKNNIFNHIPSDFNIKGGTSIKYLDLLNNKAYLQYIQDIIKKLLSINKIIEQELSINKEDYKIAILSPYRDSVKNLRNTIYPKFTKYVQNIEINTIDSIQGMTTHFTILFIPYRNESFSFNLNRFNVATSRSMLCTLIVTDETYKQFNPAKDFVAKYLDSINNI